MIRPATAEDLGALVQLEALALPDPWSRDQLAQALANPIGRAVLALEPEPVGYALGTTVAGEAEVLRVGVDPAWRRRGLGRALVEALLRGCAAEEVFLEVRASNTPAIALYAALGFSPVGRRRGYYANGEDAVVLRRCGPPSPMNPVSPANPVNPVNPASGA